MGEERTYKELLRDNRIIFPKKGIGSPRKKYYKSEREEEGQSATNWWSHEKFGHNQEANNEMTGLFDGVKNIFSNPKPLALIKNLIRLSNAKNTDIILDFFTGSGSTAQSVFELNNDDNGNRKFILVQLPEQTPEKSEARKAGYKKISDITIERVKRVIEGYGDDPKPLESGFKVYQLTQSHFPRTEFKPDPEKNEAENIETLKQYIDEKEKQLIGLFEATEIQDEVLLKNGFKLNYTLSDASEFTANTVKLADDGEKQSFLCLDTKLQSETVNYLLSNPQNFICLEISLSTSDKWNLRNHLKHRFIAF
jgi:adenine-specific DNA-methyltransferase